MSAGVFFVNFYPLFLSNNTFFCRTILIFWYFMELFVIFFGVLSTCWYFFGVHFADHVKSLSCVIISFVLGFWSILL